MEKKLQGVEMVKVMLIDDHAIVREGLRQMLSEIKGIQVVGEAANGKNGIHLARELSAEVIILDFKLPDITGLEVTNRLLHIDSNLKILVITSAMNDLFPFRVLEAGAQGYLTKDASKEEFVKAIKTINNGDRYISSQIAKRLALAKVDFNNNEGFNELTNREIEVMMMIICNVSTQTIAERLFLSSKTVHSYRSKIFEKLKVKNEVALTLLAIRDGIITLEEASNVIL